MEPLASASHIDASNAYGQFSTPRSSALVGVGVLYRYSSMCGKRPPRRGFNHSSSLSAFCFDHLEGGCNLVTIERVS